jgi:hypothetical protein
MQIFKGTDNEFLLVGNYAETVRMGVCLHHTAPQVESSGRSLTQDVVQGLGNLVLRDGSEVD